MSKGCKRIALILVGLLLIIGSLIWMSNSTLKNPAIPAITFSAGLIAILETIKRIMQILPNDLDQQMLIAINRGTRKDVF